MTTDTRRVWLTTLGCAKNQVDSDKLSAILADAGYDSASSPEEADVVMVNTCAFIEAAREESVGTIMDLENAKRDDAKLVVLGCMAQRFGVEVEEAFPTADAVLGLDRYSGRRLGFGRGLGLGCRRRFGWRRRRAAQRADQRDAGERKANEPEHGASHPLLLWRESVGGDKGDFCPMSDRE